MAAYLPLAPAKREDVQYSLKKLVVAHDFSEASRMALEDAIFLGKKFNAEILVAYVQAMSEETIRGENRDSRIDLESVGIYLSANGVRHRELLRGGVVGDSLFNLCCSEGADLLMLGAYGYGPQDRLTLGSTAEYLLRAMPCPVLTYGPSVTSSLASLENKGSVLLPIFLPCESAQLLEAVAIAKFFGAKLDLLHVEEGTGMPSPRRVTEDREQEVEKIASGLRQDGVSIACSILHGDPVEIINTRSRDLDTIFILMPLRWRKRLSSITSDNVAAHVIRSSTLPVMTYRIE